jgi:hypothetical protein
VTKAKISQYSATANDNTDVNGVNIAEGCPPSSMNNMGREIMAALKRFQVGSDGDGVTVGGALVVSGATTLTTVSATVVQSDTVSEKTSAAGVTIDGVLLKDSGVVTGAGTVSAPVYSTTGDLNTGIFFPAADTIAFAEGGAEAMRIDSDGNVGIGSTSPTTYVDAATSLVVQTSSGRSGITLVGNQSSANEILGRINFTDSGSTNLLYRNAIIDGVRGSDDNSAYLTFSTSSSGNPAERARITSGGDLCINTTSSSISGGTSGYICIDLSNADKHALNINSLKEGFTAIFIRKHNTSGTSYPMYINNSADSNVGSISMTNSAVAFNTSSDYRLKENIAPMTGALEKIAQLKPVTYTWKEDGSAGQGFIAHELQEVVPDCVTGEKDATEIRQVEVSPAIPATFDDDGNELTPAIEAVYEEREVPRYQGVDTSFLVATLTAAIQELKAELDEAKARIAALEQA